MSTIYDRIFAAAHQLSKQGKTPTLGLLKAKVGKVASTKEIITGLQQWKQNPQLGESQIPEDNIVEIQNDSLEDKILQATIPLLKRIEKLESKIAKLEAQNKK